MNIIKIWDTGSTNYGTNAFVDQNGTDTLEMESTDEAMEFVSAIINTSTISKVEITLPTGCLVWTKNATVEFCDCGECDDCLNRMDYESYMDDEYDINDPRM